MGTECLYIYTCECVNIWMHVCMCVNTCMHVCIRGVCVCVWVCVHVIVLMLVCVRCVYVCFWMHRWECACVCMFICVCWGVSVLVHTEQRTERSEPQGWEWSPLESRARLERAETFTLTLISHFLSIWISCDFYSRVFSISKVEGPNKAKQSPQACSPVMGKKECRWLDVPKPEPRVWVQGREVRT